MDTVARGARTLEAAERQIDAFIERRSRNGEMTADDVDVGYLESCRRFHERSEAEMRERWVEYEQHMAELHTRLAEEHREKAQKLCGEGEGGGGYR